MARLRLVKSAAERPMTSNGELILDFRATRQFSESANARAERVAIPLLRDERRTIIGLSVWRLFPQMASIVAQK